jgi:hypothetical protein
MTKMLVRVASGLLALICTSCTPAQKAAVPAPGPTTGMLQHRAHLCSDATSFIKSVRILKTPYDPESFTDPSADEAAELTTQQMADLQRAFELAPAYFRAEVCSLDGVFVDRSTCADSDSSQNQNIPPCYTFSWGFRNPQTGRRFVAISASLWRNGHAPRITEYSGSRLRALLAALNAGPVKFWFDTVDSHDPANSPGMTVLAALAHETGHVRWFDWNVLVAHQMQEAPHYDFARLSQCGTNRLYFDDGWGSPSDPTRHDVPDSVFYAPPWLEFAATADETKVVHDQPPQIADFKRDRLRAAPTAQRQFYQPRGSVRNLAQNLVLLYDARHPWPSLLGSLHPEHDLVETYVFGVLTYNGKQNASRESYLSSLRLNIALAGNKTRRVDIVDDYWHARKLGLSQKVECLTSLSLSDMGSTSR